MRILFSLPLFALAATAQAACPPPHDFSEEIDHLMIELLAAGNQNRVRQISSRLWQLWATAPDARAQTLMDEGMRRSAEFNFPAAQDAFDQLVTYCPDYAEGYNQRAFVAFLQKDYTAALVDLDRALARDPDQIAALAGKALTQIGLNGPQAGQQTLREALELNPWLTERQFLIEEPGEDI